MNEKQLFTTTGWKNYLSIGRTRLTNVPQQCLMKHDKRRSIALRNYGMEKCKKAIKVALSSWHTGNNPQNKTYNELSLIFRNSDKVEMFIDIYETESTAQEELDKWINED